MSLLPTAPSYRRRGSPGKRRGAAVVEFAIVAPVFFLLVLGLMETARAFMVMHQLNDAARLGCRKGVVPGRTNAAVDAAVADYLKEIGIKTATTQVRVNGKPGSLATTKEYDQVTVTISVPLGNVTWLPGGGLLSPTVALNGQHSLCRE